jgi:anti-sigma B factor antagonist
MLINCIDKDGYKVCEVKGKRIDASNVVEFRDAIIKSSEAVNTLLLDMVEVDFADSSALSAIVYIYKIFQQQNKKLILIGLSKKVLSIFDLTGLSDLFEIYPTFVDFIDKTEH